MVTILTRPSTWVARVHAPTAYESDSAWRPRTTWKNGLVLNIDGQLWTVIEFQHVKPGKGPFVRTKLRTSCRGKVVDKTFNAGVKVETANVDKRTMQYLYNDGTDFVFMDPDTYDQISVSPQIVGTRRITCWRTRTRSCPATTVTSLYIELPASVVGDQLHRAGSAERPLHRRYQADHAGNGRRDPGPLFLGPAPRSKVDTRDGSTSARQLIVRDGIRGPYGGTHQGTASARPQPTLFEAEARASMSATFCTGTAPRRCQAIESVYGDLEGVVDGTGARSTAAQPDTYSRGWPVARMPAVVGDPAARGRAKCSTAPRSPRRSPSPRPSAQRVSCPQTTAKFVGSLFRPARAGQADPGLTRDLRGRAARAFDLARLAGDDRTGRRA